MFLPVNFGERPAVGKEDTRTCSLWPLICAAGEWESCPKAPTSASLLDTQCVPAFLAYYFSTLVSSYVMSFRGIFCLKYADKDSGLY